ncbi:MAG: FAD-binding protein [Bacteroidales bacterium]|jgi:FAD/FMN-containing dehydrogenase/Fe-S oxidoreductase|nr:FAD-binding protein [Bacteroidales bacterium]
MHKEFHLLRQNLDGELLTDGPSLTIYATDASLYFDLPLAVAIPKNENDLVKIIAFASKHCIPITPRAAGTSLAGQATGSGIIVDISKHFRKIIKLNTSECYVIVQPGVVRDELNKFLEPYGLMFCPETSTSSRCMIGGMVGNNSCGEHSLIYGSTRDHIISATCLLSDGSKVEFGPRDKKQLEEKCTGDSLENRIYRKLKEILETPQYAEAIQTSYPEPAIKRRNTGYALDVLLHTEIFDDGSNEIFNVAKLICGSEGTLAFITEVKLNLVKIPTQETAFVCAHFNTLEQSLEANLVILEHQPTAVELIDKNIVVLTKNNLSQKQNRFFIEGEPEAILIIELAHDNEKDLIRKINEVIDDLKRNGMGYHYPVITGDDMTKVRNLRKAGLGVLANVTSELKPHSFVEDTAVAPERLPSYIAELKAMLNSYGISCAFYGHISTGELHFKPVLNLRTREGIELLKTIAYETALLVKKYRGSLSGEHGDGRLRAEFIPMVLGETVYQCLKDVKNVFDPQHIFNRNKIIEAPCITNNLREQRLADESQIKTFFDFSESNGFLRTLERCSGSADCRKSHNIGGLMCPSYMVSWDEKNTTRARVNLLREMLTNKKTKKPFAKKELYDILDLCLMCKGCKTECPSGIDMARYKSEFLQHYYDKHHIPLRTQILANIRKLNKIGALLPVVYNFIIKNKLTSILVKKLIGFAPQRSIPLLGKTTLKKWAGKYLAQNNGSGKSVYFFADEFTNYTDVETGKIAVMLLVRLGYNVKIAPISDSGRSYFSKGLLHKAKKIANKNIEKLTDLIKPESPMIGIEPSAVLSFRDEYPDIVNSILQKETIKIGQNILTIEEFISNEFDGGNFDKRLFTKDKLFIKLHGHCHQKSISTVLPSKRMLEIPENYHVEEIPSGCCGMAGSFGYEKEHYEFSIKIGEMILFPSIKSSNSETVISAPGYSCRQQISDGTGRRALHPVEVLFLSLVR